MERAGYSSSAPQPKTSAMGYRIAHHAACEGVPWQNPRPKSLPKRGQVSSTHVY